VAEAGANLRELIERMGHASSRAALIYLHSTDDLYSLTTRRASVSADGTVLAGSLEPRALQFVQEWASLRHKEILANWERARDSQPMLAIPPLP
jgi:hypothetical protein